MWTDAQWSIGHLNCSHVEVGKEFVKKPKFPILLAQRQKHAGICWTTWTLVTWIRNIAALYSNEYVTLKCFQIELIMFHPSLLNICVFRWYTGCWWLGREWEFQKGCEFIHHLKAVCIFYTVEWNEIAWIFIKGAGGGGFWRGLE